MTVATTASKITHQVSGWLARTVVGRLAGRSIASLVRVEVFDRAMTLAAQAFTSILPIVVAVAAFNPSNADQLGGTLAEQLGLTADASRVLEGSLPDGATVQRSLGVVGLVLILLSSTSFSRALERMYARVWEVDRVGFRGAWRWLACLLAIVLAVFLLRFTRRAVDGTSYGAEVGILVQLVVWAVVWTFVPWLLLVRKPRAGQLTVNVRKPVSSFHCCSTAHISNACPVVRPLAKPMDPPTLSGLKLPRPRA